jgi:tRNA (guanine10-N2)-dimethyltransferase
VLNKDMLLIKMVKQNLDISFVEAESLLGKGKCSDDISLFLDIKNNYQRLSYSHSADKVLFTCTEKALEEAITAFQWNKIIKGSFCVRCEGIIRKKERKIGGLIYDRLKNPLVDLSSPDTIIVLHEHKEDIFVCVRLWQQEDDYNSRKPHMRPEMHPSGLHPRLAKAMVNMTGIRQGTVVDPCCGSGGILLEAALLGFHAVGYDIDRIMINRSRINMDSYTLTNYNLIQKDALTIRKKMSYIVSDLPYAKNTKTFDIDMFLRGFFDMLSRCLLKRAVIAFPDTIDYNKFLNRKELEVKNSLSYPLHRNLSKRIIIIHKK